MRLLNKIRTFKGDWNNQYPEHHQQNRIKIFIIFVEKNLFWFDSQSLPGKNILWANSRKLILFFQPVPSSQRYLLANSENLFCFNSQSLPDKIIFSKLLRTYFDLASPFLAKYLSKLWELWEHNLIWQPVPSRQN